METLEQYHAGQLAPLDQCKVMILRLEKDLKQNILDIGRILSEVRELLRHNKQGGFEQWIETELGWGKSSVYRFLQVYDRFQTFPDLGQLALPHTTLYLLAENSTPETARQQVIERAESGEQLTYKQVTEIIQTCRRSGSNFKTQGTRLGHKKTRGQQDAEPEPPRTLCVFCNAVNVPTYAFDPSGSGICLPCAQKAIQILQQTSSPSLVGKGMGVR